MVRFARDLTSFGSRVALVDPVAGTVRYEVLAAEVALWRDRLKSLAGGGGRRLLLAVELAPRLPVISAYLAALADGHPVILGAPGTLGPDSAIARRYQPEVLLAMVGDVCVARATGAAPADLHPDLALLLSTSGSTGDPRLVRLSAEAVQSNAAAIAAYLGLTPSDRALTTLPLHYSYGLSVLHAHLAAGGSVVLSDMSVTDAAFGDTCVREGVTNLPLVPHQIDLLLTSHFEFGSLPALRFVTQAGGRLAPEKVRTMAGTAKRGGWAFYVMYGQTEAGPRIAYLPPEMAQDHPDTIGRAIPGGRLSVVAADGCDILSPGVAGELVYDGPNVMLGYADTRGDLALGREVTSLRTGDIAERTEAGLIRILGREKRFVKLFGLRLSLDQIEARLTESGLDAHAVAVDDRLVLLTTDASALAKITACVADAYALPRTDVHTAAIPAVPHLTNGKPDLRALATLAAEALARRGARRVPLATAYAEALRRTRIRPQDSFAALGGDSLAYLHIQLALEERFGEAPEGWEDMPLSELERQAPAPRPSSVRVDPATILRVGAIATVALFHLTHWPVMGGTWLLVLLMGLSLARFQHMALGRGQVERVAWTLFYPVLPIYFAILLGFHVLREPVDPALFLMMANNAGWLPNRILEPMWFISLYVQLVLVVLALASVDPIRRRIATAPFAFGTGLLVTAIGLSLAYQAAVAYDAATLKESTARGLPILIRTLPVCLPFLALGWMVQFSDTPGRKIIALWAILLVLAVFPSGGLSTYLMAGYGAMTLILVRHVRVPSVLAGHLTLMAGATFFVYLTHNLLIHVVKYVLPVYAHLGAPVTAMLFLPAAFLLGLGVERGFARGERWARSLLFTLMARSRSWGR